jgi:RsiW-degrading membrane proteinase PrsW (M82 family)
MLPINEWVIISGKVNFYKNKYQIFLLYHPILVILIYCIFYLYSGNYKHKRLIKLVSLFLIMIIFALYQSQSLHELKIHYSHYNTGETWQQYGAL